MTSRPIFIYGCPRSGTSLLARIVGAHPRIAIPFESHIYHYLWNWRHVFGDLKDPRRRQRLVKDILGMEDLREWRPAASLERTLAAIQRPDFHGVFEALMTAWASDRGKPRWGEKTPQHTLQWAALLEGFPDLQIIHLVRDGRDVAVSYKKAFFGPKHAFHLARRWLRFLEAASTARDAVGEDQFIEVRYEDLLADPEATTQRVCGFLGEEFVSSMLKTPSADTVYPTDEQNLGNLRKPILSSNTGKWREEMSARDLRIFEAVAGDGLEHYGYARGLPGASVSPLEILSFKYFENPPVKALALLGNHKSQRIAGQLLVIWLRWRLGLWRRTAAQYTSVGGA